MNGYRKLIHLLPSLVGLVVLTVGGLLWPKPPVIAAVTLVSFEVATAAGDSGISVMWQSESEFQTTAYQIRRAVASSDVGDAVEIHVEFARSATGASYDWLDDDSDVLELGQEYFYWLYEVTTGGEIVQLRVGDQAYRSVVFGETSASTATATSTSTATAMPTATATSTSAASPSQGTTGSTSTPTRGQATATQRATSTPTFTPIPPTNIPTFTPVLPTSIPATTVNTPTPQQASNTTSDLPAPTSILPTATLLVIQPTVARLPASPEPVVQPEAVPALAAETATVTTLPQQITQLETEVTRAARPTATPRPTEAVGSSSQVSTLLLVVGGGSLCGAGLLILVAIFVWRRR